MVSEVFYRKWRPQKLVEVVGQESITETLRHAVTGGKVAHHAYLFCGPRGTGKTSTGRILAKAINCPNQIDGEPCNACETCRSITAGKALDVIEIDAASNRGIDEIRSLREKVNYAPSLTRYKVYIIDEVHMLTEAACNALLKTLEEPPPHTVFVLATTEAHKVIPTIVSRCQRFNFHRLSQTAIVDKLTLICRGENITVGLDSLRLVARAATGSLRDAENILQQLIAHYGNQIDFSQAQEALGLGSDSRVRQLGQCIINKDVSAGLRVINSVNGDGLDLRQFNTALVGYLRELLLAKSGCNEALDVTAEDVVEMERVVADAELHYLLRAVKLFAGIDFRTDSYSTLPLELALVDCVLPSMTGQTKAGITESLQTVKDVETTELVRSFQETVAPVVVNEEKTFDTKVSLGFEYLHSRWREFIQSLRGEGSSGNLDAFLRSACEPVALKDDMLVLGFRYPFHKEKIEDAKYRHLIERKLKEFFGHPYKIECILVEQKKTLPQTRLQNPLIKAAIDMGARVVD